MAWRRRSSSGLDFRLAYMNWKKAPNVLNPPFPGGMETCQAAELHTSEWKRPKWSTEDSFENMHGNRLLPIVWRSELKVLWGGHTWMALAVTVQRFDNCAAASFGHDEDHGNKDEWWSRSRKVVNKKGRICNRTDDTLRGTNSRTVLYMPLVRKVSKKKKKKPPLSRRAHLSIRSNRNRETYSQTAAHMITVWSQEKAYGALYITKDKVPP